MPLAGGICASAARNPRRSDSARRRCALFPPSRPRGGAAARCIGEFAEAIGEFDAADIELETLGQPRIAGAGRASAASQRGIFDRESWRARCRASLDPLDQHAAENVGPAIVVGDRGCRRPRRPGRASRSGVAIGSVAKRSMSAKRAKASATLSRSGSAKGSAVRPRNANAFAPPPLGRSAQDRGAVLHQRRDRSPRRDTIRAW